MKTIIQCIVLVGIARIGFGFKLGEEADQHGHEHQHQHAHDHDANEHHAHIHDDSNQEERLGKAVTSNLAIDFSRFARITGMPLPR